MPKGYKIKRYDNIYQKPGISPFRFTIILLAIAAVAFLGVSLYGPIRDFASGRIARHLASASSSVASQPEAGPQEGKTGSAPETPPPTAETDLPALQLSELRGVLIPHEELLRGDIKGFVESTGLTDVNAVLIDLKDVRGGVLYRSTQPLAATLGESGAGLLDLKTAVSQINAAGYHAVARLYAFRDASAALADEAMGITQSGGLLWLDADSNGKTWLNPYSPDAQQYITDLALEAVDSGVSSILLTGVQFPVGQKLSSADYGEWAKNKSKSDVLREYVENLRAKAGEKGASVFCYTPADTILGLGLGRYGDALPQSIYGDPLGVGAMPALFGSSFRTEGLALSEPVKNPYDTVKTVTQAVQNAATPVKTPILFVQGYSDEALGANYTSTQVNEQIRALGECGLESYVVLY